MLLPTAVIASKTWTYFSRLYQLTVCFYTLAARRRRGGVNRGRLGVLAGAAGIGCEPAILVAQHRDVQLDGRPRAEIEDDVRDGARVARRQRLGCDGARLVGVLAA